MHGRMHATAWLHAAACVAGGPPGRPCPTGSPWRRCRPCGTPTATPRSRRPGTRCCPLWAQAAHSSAVQSTAAPACTHAGMQACRHVSGTQACKRGGQGEEGSGEGAGRRVAAGWGGGGHAGWGGAGAVHSIGCARRHAPEWHCMECACQLPVGILPLRRRRPFAPHPPPHPPPSVRRNSPRPHRQALPGAMTCSLGPSRRRPQPRPLGPCWRQWQPQ